MTIIVTRDVADRFRGFLASVMLEIAPGVYTSPRMSKAVRQRVWGVMTEWQAQFGGNLVLTWREPRAPGGQGLLHLGHPRRDIVDEDGVLLVKRAI